MAHSRRHLILFACLLTLLCATPSWAQQYRDKPADNTQSNSGLQQGPVFTVVALENDPLLQGLVFMRGKEPVKITARTGVRSSPIALGAYATKLIFGTEQTDPKTQQKVFIPAAEAAWPNGVNKALVFLTAKPGPDGKSQLRVVIVDDDVRVFPANTVRVLNGTGVPLLAKIGTFQGTLAPGFSPPQAYPKPELNAQGQRMITTFPFALAANLSDGTTKLLYSVDVDSRPGTRTLIIVLSPAQQGSEMPRVTTLVDSAPPPSRR